MISNEEACEKVREGWLRSWMMFEVLAVNEDTTKNSLERLINKLERDSRARMCKREFGEMKRVEKPLPNVNVGYSLTCEVELIANKFDNLVQIVTEYGPSAIELLEPLKFSIDAGEGQAILNSISQMMHEFAAAGAGGIVFLKGD